MDNSNCETEKTWQTSRMVVIVTLAMMVGLGSTMFVWADHTQPEIVKGSTIIGKSVQNMEGKEIGEIKDLAIDELDGDVRYAVLSFGGILGLGEKYFAIPWEALHLSDDKKHFALAVTEKQLEKAPGFDKNNWPDFADPVYYATIYDFYQVPVPDRETLTEQKMKSTKPSANHQDSRKNK